MSHLYTKKYVRVIIFMCARILRLSCNFLEQPQSHHNEDKVPLFFKYLSFRLRAL